MRATIQQIPASAAVFASQGVVGRFAARRDVRPMNGDLPLGRGQDWFVFTPPLTLSSLIPGGGLQRNAHTPLASVTSVA